MEKKTPIDEARRYLQNAKTILKEKAEIDETGKYYNDSKYVKMAGNCAWNGVLIALESVFHIRTKNQRPDIDKYRDAMARKDKKALKTLNSAYNHLHMFMGYDGEKATITSKTGISEAKVLIDWCEAHA